MYAHEKQQEREQWEQRKAGVDPTEQTLRAEYDQARIQAFQEFCSSDEGRAAYDKAFPILLTLHKLTDPHRADEAARQATVARMERENFEFPEFALCVLERQKIDSPNAI